MHRRDRPSHSAGFPWQLDAVLFDLPERIHAEVFLFDGNRHSKRHRIDRNV